MPTFGWILIAVVVIAAIAATAVLARRGSSHTALRRRFGPEYDRALATHGDRRTAERHLGEIAQRRDALTVSPLTPDARADYSARWETLQARFIDDPAGATAQADLLISDVMRARGYPAGSFEERAELLSADHPELVAQAREARERAHGSAGQPGDAAVRTDPAGPNGAETGSDLTRTEVLRTTFVHYRALFERLLGEDEPAEERDGARPHRTPAAAAPAPRQREA